MIFSEARCRCRGPGRGSEIAELAGLLDHRFSRMALLPAEWPPPFTSHPIEHAGRARIWTKSESMGGEFKWYGICLVPGVYEDGASNDDAPYMATQFFSTLYS